MKHFTLSPIYLMALMAILSCQKAPLPSPNIVIFYTDDQGTLDVNCFGSQDLYTPNLDKLAATGVKFTQAYAHTVCCPSRAALLTGRHPQRVNVNSWTQSNANQKEDGRNMPLEEMTLAEIAKQKHYRTALFGKWHVGGSLKYGPLEQGFDEFFGFRGGFIDNYNHHALHGKGFHDLWDRKEEVYLAGQYFQDMITEKALSFVEANQDQPFLLYLGFNIPHYPEQADEKFDEHYQNVPEPRKSYGKIVSTVDDRIGQIMSKLEALGLRENTLIFFVSDNGHSIEDYQISVDDHRSGYPKGHNYGANGGGGNTGKWIGAKNSFLEGGIRVPAIMSFPARFPLNTSRNQIVTVMDLLPTLCDVLKVPLPASGVDGQSLLPIVMEDKASSHYNVLHYQWQDRWMVREGEWKLLYKDTKGYFQIGPETPRMDSIHLGRLTDAEPERKNYAAEKPEIVARLTQFHETWAEEVMQ
ncbi:MAG: sulfatase-like hydrolase/transferase [Bacteroidota bacterium]